MLLMLTAACQLNVGPLKQAEHGSHTIQQESGNDSQSHTAQLPTPTAPGDKSSTSTYPSAESANQHDQQLKLLAVGDIMMHSPQFPAYYNRKTGGYSFNSYFDLVKPYITQADLAWANLETPLLGGEREYTGYPRFNAPAELADALRYAGFDIVTNANNHSLDRSERGVLKTLEVLKQRQFITKGTFASKWESEQPTVIEKNGIKLGILAYTYGTNGISLPKDKPYMVALIDEDKIIKDIRLARQAGADVIAIALHFGNEYEPDPNQQQIKLARKLVAAGADIILGSHPHVLQPYERVTVHAADGHKRDGIIMYSMGNFVSNQRGEGKDIGVMLQLTIKKRGADGTIQILDTEVHPTWVYRAGTKSKRTYKIVPLKAVAYEKQTSTWSKKQRDDMKRMLNSAMKHLRSRPHTAVVKALT
nr:CapA family protein [Paenibacillus sp. ACRRX]